MKQKIRVITALMTVLILMMCILVGCGKKQQDEATDDTKTPAPDDGATIVQRTISPTIDTVVPEASPDASATTVEPSETPVPSATVNPTETGDFETTATVTAADINVRETADANATVLGTLPLNTTVNIVKKDAGNGWTEIEYNGAHAFVASYLLNFDSSSNNANTAVAECKATVVDDNINVRAEATTDSAVVGQAAKGDTLDVLKKDAGNGWTMVLFEGKTAYVAAYLLDFAE